MKKYKVMLEGRNFLIEMNRQIAKHGFYQTFFIEGSSREDAESNAVHKVRNSPDLRKRVLNASDNPPMIHVKQLVEIPSFPEDCPAETGRAWYPESEE